MNRFFAWILLASALLAGQTYRYPIQYSGGAVSHADADGYRHVPRTLGQTNGNCLLTHGASGDSYWGACPGASGGLDSAHVSALISDSLDANNHGWTDATALHDTADVLRAYTRDQIHDSIGAITPARIGAAPAFTSGSANQFWATPNGSSGAPSLRAIVAADVPTLNQNTTGSAATLTTGRTIAVSGDVTGTATSFNGSANISIPATVTKINGVALSGLGTGIVKNTTGTGAPSIAVAGDFPTLNQNTTGSAAKWTTPRVITIGATGKNLDGTGDVSWTLGDIGAAPATGGSYLPLAGGTMAAAAAVTFPGAFGGAILRDYTASISGSGYFAIYGSGVTPSSANYSLAVRSDGAGTHLNGTTSSFLSVSDVPKVQATSTGASIFGTLSASGNLSAPSATIGTTSAILKRTAGVLGDATSSNILAGISADLWIGSPSGRGANSIGFGNLATGTGLWGWAFAQDADGAALINAPSGKTISYNIGGVQQGYTDYLGFHMTALGSTDVTSTNNTTSNSMINTQDRRAYSTLTATNAASPGYGPDIMNITGPAHSLAPAASGSTYRQYRMPTASGKSGVVIVLSLGTSGPVNAPYLLAYTGEAIHEKDNGTVVGDDTSPYVRSGTIALISDGAGWWVF